MKAALHRDIAINPTPLLAILSARKILDDSEARSVLSYSS